MPLQIRRGTDLQRQGITPALGEPIFVTDTNELYIGDGTTAGGNLISGGNSASVVWGDITGTLTSQTDLASALSGKADTGHTHSDVTESTSGFMSASDKVKLNGIATGATANTGTVTSVGLSLPTTLFTNPASPIDTSGTLTATFNAVTANTILAGPTTGSAAAPTMRALVAADLPTHTHTASDIDGLSLVATTGNYANLTGTPELGSAAYVDSSTFANASHSHSATDITTGTFNISRIPTGTTDITVCIGNDSRLSNERTPIDNSVSTSKIQSNAVTSDKIEDAAVTMAKIAQSGATTNQVIKWNGSAWAPADDETTTGSAGAPSDAEYLVKSSNGGLGAERVVFDSTSIVADWNTLGRVQLHRAALTGDVTADVNNNATTIANNAVTTNKILDSAVTLSKLENVPASSIIGNTKTSTGVAEFLPITSAGFALLDDADAAAQRTTLGAAADNHIHGNLTNDGKIGSAAGLVVKTGADGIVTTLSMGTAGQVLKVNSDATDIEWGADNTSTGSGDVGGDVIWDAKGDLAVGTGDNTAQKLSTGTNGQYLVAASSETTGLKWQDLAIGSTSGLPIKTGTNGVLEVGAFGTSAGEFAQGNHTHGWTEITDKPTDFTPSAHMHALADLQQGGATSGQVVTWNGIAWAPATPSGNSSSSSGLLDPTTELRIFTTFAAPNGKDNPFQAYNYGSTPPFYVVGDEDDTVGVIRMSTGTGASSHRAALYMSSDTYASRIWRFEDVASSELRFKARFVDNNLASAPGVMTAGFSNTGAGTIGGAFYAAHFIVDSTDTTKYYAQTKNSTATGTDTGVSAASTNTWKHFRILVEEVSGTLTAFFYIDGSLVATHTTNLPVGAGRALAPFFGIQKTDATATASNFDIDYCYLRVAYKTGLWT